MIEPDYKIQELFAEFDDVYGGSTSYSLDYLPVIYDGRYVELRPFYEELKNLFDTGIR